MIKINELKSSGEKNIEETTVIGGGFSGLYSAVRLTEPGVGRYTAGQVSVREKEERIGGRLHTVQIPASDGLHVEIGGGMRFPEADQNLRELIGNLGLETLTADDMSNQHFHYARGQKIELKDYQHPEKIPYNLAPDEQKLTPGQLVVRVLESIVPGVSNVETPEALTALLDSTFIDGKSLREYNLGDLVRPRMSDEAYQLICDAYGFVGLFEGHNAYDKMYHNFSHGKGNDFYKLKNGAVSLIDALARKAGDQGVTIYTGQEFTAVKYFDPNAENPFFVLSFKGNDDVYARHIVLTISPLAMLTLDRNSVIFHDPMIRDVLETSKRTVTAVKLALVYDTPWWHEKGLKNGRLHTSTPLRQLYDFGGNSKAGVLCIYKDNGPDWVVPDNDTGELYDNREVMPEGLKVPRYIIEAVTQELRAIFNDPNIQKPRTAVWHVWKEKQGAFFQWKPNVNSNDNMAALKKLKNITITGDNLGKDTGWVAAAQQEVDQSLERQFGIKKTRPKL